MDDERIIELFFQRNQQGIRELDTKYGPACHKLSYQLVNDWQDAEDFIAERSGKEIPVKVLRDGKEVDTILIPCDGKYGITNLQEAVIGRSISPDFQPGDRIISANGKKIEYTLDLYSIKDESMLLTIDRNGEILERQTDNGTMPFAWKSDLRKTDFAL